MPDDKADISAAFLLISYCSYWSLSWFYYILKRFFLNLKGLSDASVASLTKKEYGLAVHSLWILMKSLVLISDMNDLLQFVEVLFYLEFLRQKSE